MSTLIDALVLFHGRKHRHIQEVSYENSKFLDINEEHNPDYELDAGNYITPLIIRREFKHVINAFGPISITFGNVKNAVQDISEGIIDGKLNIELFMNIRKFLVDDGLFYMRPIFSVYSDNFEDEHIRNVKLFEEKMFRFGFKLVETNKTFTFNSREITDFLVFKKVSLPEVKDVWEYLQNRVTQTSPQTAAIKWVKIRLHNPNFDDFETILYYPKNGNLDPLKFYFGLAEAETKAEAETEVDKTENTETNDNCCDCGNECDSDSEEKPLVLKHVEFMTTEDRIVELM